MSEKLVLLHQIVLAVLGSRLGTVGVLFASTEIRRWSQDPPVAAALIVLKDLNMPVEVVVGETTRDPDGVAMSSRNAYMTEAERAAAPVVYLSLQAAADARTRAAEAGRCVRVLGWCICRFCNRTGLQQCGLCSSRRFSLSPLRW